MISNQDTELPFDRDRLQQKIDNKTKPIGSLGAIEKIALKVGSLQRSLSPRMSSCQLTIFAADHGIAESGTSAFPQDVTRQMLKNFLAGGAAANVFAKTLDVAVQIVDAGVAGDAISSPDLDSHRIAAGTRNFLTTSAMTKNQFLEALNVGRKIGSSGNYDAICLGEMGIGNTAAATLILSKLLQLPIETLTGRGTGLDSAGLKRKVATLLEAAERCPEKLAPEEVLTEYGGFEIVMMCGAMLGASSARTLVIVDGFIATAAATAAIAIDATARDAMLFSHRSAEKGHQAALQALGEEALLDLDLRLGEGTGALLAWPIVKSAAAMLTEMASFDSASISGPG